MKIVMKYGGSSLSTPTKIQSVAKIIQQRKQPGDEFVIVVSAMGKTTDLLIEKALSITKRPSDREMDLLLSTGEMMSASLLTMALHSLGVPAISLTGFQAGIQTSGFHRKNRIQSIDPSRIREALAQDQVVVVTGFQGVNETGDITTLGRGGSDTSAVALAAVLDASCEIYTDVAGIFSVDPRIRKTAIKLDQITYEETMEMANLGAKVLEPRSVELAEKYDVPMKVALSTGESTGTVIKKEKNDMETHPITNISKIDDILVVSVIGKDDVQPTLTQCFVELARKNINIDIISYSMDQQRQPIFSFTTLAENNVAVEELLKSLHLTYHIKGSMSKVSIIGSAMRNQAGIAATAFQVFLENKISLYEVSTSEISISYVVDQKDALRTVEKLADKFNL